jgi:DNA-binding SARP family transcriptional activator
VESGAHAADAAAARFDVTPDAGLGGLEFRILGPMEVVRDGQPVSVGGARPRAVLALLLLNANRTVSSDRMIEELWHSPPPDTALNSLHVHISHLRSALEPDRAASASSRVILRRDPGYAIQVADAQFDLFRFESLWGDARRSLLDGDAGAARSLLATALDLWRGDALSDLTAERFTSLEARRLDEMRVEAQLDRIDADLALAQHSLVVGELEMLTSRHPTHERIHQRLMLALYRCGRHADALAVYARARRTLVDELGLEPSPALRDMERAILRHDDSLQAGQGAGGAAHTTRSTLLAARTLEQLEALADVVGPVASASPDRELILALLMPASAENDAAELATATERLAAQRQSMQEGGLSTRVAALRSSSPGEDAARLADEHAVDLVLADLGSTDAQTLLARAPCDVLLMAGPGRRAAPTAGPVVVPFGGGENDWAALQAGAWLARATGVPLRVVGADDGAGGGSPSRLLAAASLIVQRLCGIVPVPVLAAAGHDGIVAAAADARVLVLGASDRWRAEGVGAVRTAIAAGSNAPTLVARRGTRPGEFAPAVAHTRLAWSLAGAGG